jgi:hypothetical protein
MGEKRMVDKEIPPTKIGDELPSGGIVLKFRWREHTKGEAEGQHGIVLCLLTENEYDPFAVWGFVKPKDGKIFCMHGDYVQNIDIALRHFNRRSSVGSPYKP